MMCVTVYKMRTRRWSACPHNLGNEHPYYMRTRNGSARPLSAGAHIECMDIHSVRDVHCGCADVLRVCGIRGQPILILYAVT